MLSVAALVSVQKQVLGPDSGAPSPDDAMQLSSRFHGVIEQESYFARSGADLMFFFADPH